MTSIEFPPDRRPSEDRSSLQPSANDIISLSSLSVEESNISQAANEKITRISLTDGTVGQKHGTSAVPKKDVFEFFRLQSPSSIKTLNEGKTSNDLRKVVENSTEIQENEGEHVLREKSTTDKRTTGTQIESNESDEITECSSEISESSQSTDANEEIHRLKTQLNQQKADNSKLRDEFVEFKQKLNSANEGRGQTLALEYQLEKSQIALINLLNDYNAMSQGKAQAEIEFKARMCETKQNWAKLEQELRDEVLLANREKESLIRQLKKSAITFQEKNAMIVKLQKRVTQLAENTRMMSPCTECDLVDEIERLMEENMKSAAHVESLERTINTLKDQLTEKDTEIEILKVEMNEWPAH